MNFLIEDDDLLEKYITIFGKVSANLKKDFDSESVYHKNYLKTKIKSDDDKAKDFNVKEIPQAGSDYTCLPVITIHSAPKIYENCYLL